MLFFYGLCGIESSEHPRKNIQKQLAFKQVLTNVSLARVLFAPWQFDLCLYRNPAFKIVFYQTNQVRMKVYQAYATLTTNLIAMIYFLLLKLIWLEKMYTCSRGSLLGMRNQSGNCLHCNLVPSSADQNKFLPVTQHWFLALSYENRVWLKWQTLSK